MRGSKVFSVVAVLGALAVTQVSGDAAWAAKKPSHEKHEKKEKKEKTAKKKEKKEDKKEDKKDEKDKRETNNCPGWLSKGCGPGACRCRVGPDEKEQKKAAEKAQKKAEEEAKKLQKAAEKAKKPKKAKKKESNSQKAESAGEPKPEAALSRPEGCAPVQALSHHSSFVTITALMRSTAGRKLNACCCDLSMFDAHLAAGTETRMGSMVARVSEEAVHNITLSAGEVPDLDSNLIDRLVQDCVEQ